MLRGHETVQALREVLHHVVALGFAVHQDIESQLLLDLHGMCDLRTDRVRVLGFCDPPRAVVRPGLADLRRLREGSDGRGGQHGQAQPLALGRAASFGISAAAVCVPHGGGALADLGPVGRRVCGPGRADRGVLGQGLADGVPAVLDAAREPDHLGHLLVRERDPALDVRVQGGLAGDVVRDVQQRRRRAHGHRPAGRRAQPVQGLGGAREVGAPHGASAHDAAHDRALAPRRECRLARDGPAVEVDGQRFDVRAGQGELGVLAGIPVAHGHEDRGALGLTGESGVRALEGGHELGAFHAPPVRGEGRFVELQPFDAGLGQGSQDRGVLGDDVVEALQGVTRDGIGGLGA